jgi:D-beta-D-heptose 7-phosphate kinase/D-beta-D-heptose 1-phosphate adenosyltransferase
MKRFDPIRAKQVDVEFLKNRDYKLVFTNGCYDLLHLGHLKVLQQAKKEGDKLVVALNSDTSIQKMKGMDRPIIPLQDRMDMISALECVDYVIFFDADTPIELIKEINPEVLVKGGDWEGNIVGSDVVEKTIVIPVVEGKSTTDIIERIRQRKA